MAVDGEVDTICAALSQALQEHTVQNDDIASNSMEALQPLCHQLSQGMEQGLVSHALAQRVAGTGVLQSLSKACTAATAATKNQHQQPQQQQQQWTDQQHRLVVHGGKLLMAWMGLAPRWPGMLLSDQPICDSVLPAIQLAVTMLHTWPGPMLLDNSSSSSAAGDGSGSILAGRQGAYAAAIDAAISVGDLMSVKVCKELVAQQQQPQEGTTLHTIVVSDDLLTLQLHDLAFVANCILCNTEAARSNSSTSGSGQQQQQQRVSSYHDGLLSALGLSRFGLQPLVHVENKRALMSLMSLKGVGECRAEYGVSRRRQQQQQQQHRQGSETRDPTAFPANVQVPIMLTAIELILLAPELPVMAEGLKLMTLVYANLHKSAGPESDMLLAKEMEVPLLLELGPHLLAALAERADAAAPEFDVTRQQIMPSFKFLVLPLFALAIHSRPMAAAFSSQPLTCCAVMEAALRARSEIDMLHAADELEAGSSLQTALLYFTHKAACSTYSMQDDDEPEVAAYPISTTAEAAAAAAGAKPQQLMSLLISCCKLAAGVCSSSSSSNGDCDWTAYGLGIFTAVLESSQMYGQLVMHFAENSRGGSAGAAATGVVLQWVMVLGRAMHLLGKLISSNSAGRSSSSSSRRQMAAGEDPNSNPNPAGMYAPWQVITYCCMAIAFVGWALEDDDLAGRQPPKGLVVPSVAAARQLLEQLMPLRAALWTAVGVCERQPALMMQVPASAAEAVQRTRQAFGADLAQQLQQFGEALCAQIPLPYCCNNPSCTSLEGVSELQLVGGRACRCSGCKVAFYCCRECQRAHWKRHKPVCEAHRP